MSRVVGDFDKIFKNTKHYKIRVINKRKKPIQYIIGILSYAMFVFLLLIGVTLLVYFLNMKIKQSKGDFTPPKFNGYVVLTGSMLPNISPNDVVITKKIEGKELKIKDVITFASSDPRWKGTIITHRIIEKFETNNKLYEFRTKGDNNNAADDALVQDANIMGKVILKIPKLGYLQTILATKSGWIFIILVPCLCVISYDVLKILKVVGKKTKKIVKR